jgi:Carboxypeptidase regulatory-like domain
MTAPLFALTLLLVQNTTASLEGFIEKIVTGEAVPNARVILNRIDGSLGEGYAVTASSGGKFLFPIVQPGRYRLFANKNGFVRAEYGQRAPNKPGTEIAVTAGQQLKEYSIQMMPTGALAGHVYDMNGEPVPNVDIAALQYKYNDGRRTLTRIQQARTNDFGEYRLFYLVPGEYFISANPLDPPRIEGNTLVMFSGPGTGVADGQRGLPIGTRIGVSRWSLFTTIT